MMPPLTRTAASDLFRTHPHRHLDVGEGEVAYRRVGTGPDVLFVHGWPASGATFRALLPTLAPHVTCHVIDLPGAGDSRFDRSTVLTLAQHVQTVRRVVDQLDLHDVALVGHDSGGMIARHALAGDPRVHAWGLVDTEQPRGIHPRFRQFLLMGQLPGFEHLLAWAAGQRWLRRSPYLLGDCFADRALLGGEFEEFLIRPLQVDRARRWAAGALVRNWDDRFVNELGEVHARMTAPVQLVWGADDPFFPLSWAEEMVGTFPDAALHVVAGGKLFVHEEFPEVVAEALLPTLLGQRSGKGVVDAPRGQADLAL